jgi:hypothetical protein
MIAQSVTDGSHARPIHRQVASYGSPRSSPAVGRSPMVGRYARYGGGEPRIGTLDAQPRVRTPDPPSAAEAACVSCGERLDGKFCRGCGEKRRDAHDLSVKHVVHDVWHELTHVDSKIWRTLKALLFAPGLLTDEYCRGRKKRYLTPLRLYIVIFAIFALVSANRSNSVVADYFDAAHGSAAAEGQVTTRMGIVTATTNLDSSRIDEHVHERLTDAGFLNVEQGSDLFRYARQQWLGRVREEMTRKFQRNVSLFQLGQPLLLSVALALLYARCRRRYVEHLVMALHLMSFAMVGSLVQDVLRFGVYWFGVVARDELAASVYPVVRLLLLVCVALVVVVPLFAYVFVAFRRCHGQSIWKTGAKGLVGAVLVYLCMYAPFAAAGAAAVTEQNLPFLR